MTVRPLAQMSAASVLSGAETFYAQQSGADVKVTASQIFTGANYQGAYTVAALPAAPPTWSTASATNGLKIGETTGNGTGMPVYFQGVWRTFSSDQPVQS